MACFDYGQVVTGAVPVLVTTVPVGHGSISLVTNTAGGVYVGGNRNVTTTTGFLVPANVPVSLDIIPNNSQLWAVSAGAGALHFIMGA